MKKYVITMFVRALPALMAAMLLCTWMPGPAAVNAQDFTDDFEEGAEEFGDNAEDFAEETESEWEQFWDMDDDGDDYYTDDWYEEDEGAFDSWYD